MAALSPPLIIAHRGASGMRPEHTIAAYDLAIEQGADFIEPDLVPTSDCILVARHENEISKTTDVASRPEFADRRSTKIIDGRETTGWFTEDFTLAELKTLRAKERLPHLRSTKYDGRYEIPTLAEIIALAQRRSVKTGRTIGIYPETKHPTYFAKIGLGSDRLLLDALRRVGWTSADAPVIIQSFEVDNLKAIAGLTEVRLIQLLDATGGPADTAEPSYDRMITPEGLRKISKYAFGIGPNKAMLWCGGETSKLVSDAHIAGLRVHPWTYRAENVFLPNRFRNSAAPDAKGDLKGELIEALGQGIDGFFTDFPEVGIRAREESLNAVYPNDNGSVDVSFG